MFKCRQCGRRFGANPPRTCPECGSTHDRSGRGLWLVLLVDNVVTVVVLAALVGIAVAVSAYLF